MLDFIKDFFRRKSLRKHSSSVPTGILPLSKIHSYVAIIDVEDQSFDACKTAILNFFRSHNIKGCVFFQDFRKIGNEDRLITSIQTTITKKDLDWIGRPSKYKLNVLEEQAPDLFISLVKDPDFAIEYMARTSKARFKIGRRQMEGNLFDFVICDPDGKNISQLDSFTAIKSYLTKIQ
jgi:hypothetical protein